MTTGKNNQAGFTLIELIMVIVILGILAATALPKFVDMSKDARVASLKGLQGAINSAASIVKSTYIVKQASPITLSDGATVTVSTSGTSAGLPTADGAGIGNALQISNDFSASYASGVATFTLNSKANCVVTYDDSTGVTALDSSGC